MPSSLSALFDRAEREGCKSLIWVGFHGTALFMGRELRPDVIEIGRGPVGTLIVEGVSEYDPPKPILLMNDHSGQMWKIGESREIEVLRRD